MLRFAKFDWMDFFRRLQGKTFEADIFNRAAQVAFYFTFSLFPFLFFLVSLFGIVLESADGFRGEIFSYLRQIMPMMVFNLVERTVLEIVQASSSTKLVIGLSAAVWAASAGVDGVRSALNAIYGLRETRSWWYTKLQSLAMTVATIVLVAVVLLIVFYGWILIKTSSEALGMPITSPLLLSAIQWVSIVAIMLFACELIYNLLPNFNPRRWIWLNVGSLVAIASWLILSTGFRTYLSFFNSYDRTYGSLGAVIVMMLWLYLTGLVIMVGGLINSVLHDIHRSESDADGSVSL